MPYERSSFSFMASLQKLVDCKTVGFYDTNSPTLCTRASHAQSHSSFLPSLINYKVCGDNGQCISPLMVLLQLENILELRGITKCLVDSHLCIIIIIINKNNNHHHHHQTIRFSFTLSKGQHWCPLETENCIKT